MDNPVEKFQRKRSSVLASLLFAAVSVGLALINQNVELVPKAYLWAVSLIGLSFHVWNAAGYRCPYCNKFPETEDVPLFNPIKCGHCGEKLK